MSATLRACRIEVTVHGQRAAMLYDNDTFAAAVARALHIPHLS